MGSMSRRRRLPKSHTSSISPPELDGTKRRRTVGRDREASKAKKLWSKPARTTAKDADAVESLTAISCSLIPRRMLSLRILTRWLLAARMPSDLGESEDPDISD